MKLVFYLLDINYEIIRGQPQVRLWGITEADKRVLIIDNDFHPYFYLLLRGRDHLAGVMKQLEEKRKQQRQIVSLEAVEKQFYGEKATVVKVTCISPGDLETIAINLSHIDGVRDHLEDDIRFSARYLIDKELKPCRWHQVEVERTSRLKGLHVSEVYRAKSQFKFIETHAEASLRLLAFSLMRYSEQGSPKALRDPVIAISVSSSSEEQRQFAAKDLDDKQVLQDFIKYV